MEIFLIRHTSVDVPLGTCYGQTDVAVSATFEQEAAIVKQQLDGTSFDHVFTSPLTRCVKLAAFCGHNDAQRDDRLKEMNMGDWEMQPFDQITDPRLQLWYDNYLEVSTTNGESYKDIYQRVTAFFDELRMKDYARVAIFAHGGILMCAQIYAGIMTAETALQKLTPYGGVINITL